jgi:hypothetical protein
MPSQTIANRSGVRYVATDRSVARLNVGPNCRSALLSREADGLWRRKGRKKVGLSTVCDRSELSIRACSPRVFIGRASTFNRVGSTQVAVTLRKRGPR